MPGSLSITFRVQGGAVCRIRTGPALQQLAIHWGYVVRNRSRWSRQQDSRKRVQGEATEALRELGIGRSEVRTMARSGVVEVSMPWRGEQAGWEARVFPWEHVLSAATKPYRGEGSLVVVRHLNTPGRSSSRAARAFAIVETAPGPLSDYYEFEAERELVSSSLRSLDPVHVPVDPTRSQLTSTLRQNSPDVIHVTGIDSSLGRQILEADSHEKELDGIYLQKRNGALDLVHAEDLGRILNSGDPDPLLVGFNCWNSGSRLAPLCVASGARTAIGLQNTFDDRAAERFYVEFYRAWADDQRDVLAAFLHAWETIRPLAKKIQGTGVTLWSATSLVSKSSTRIPANRQGMQLVQRAVAERQQQQRQTARVADPKIDRIRDLVGVRIRPTENLNYSLLHNRRSLMDEFYFWFKSPSLQPVTPPRLKRKVRCRRIR